VKAIKLEEKQARKIPTSSHLMFPIGTGERDMLLLSQEIKEVGASEDTAVVRYILFAMCLVLSTLCLLSNIQFLLLLPPSPRGLIPSAWSFSAD